MIKGEKKTFLSIMKFPGQDEIVNIYKFVDRINFKKWNKMSLICWTFCVSLIFLVLCRRSDPSTPAGLQQQPVLLWSFHPGATRDGETHHPAASTGAPSTFIISNYFIIISFFFFLSVGTFGTEISKSLTSSSESHEGKNVIFNLTAGL